MPVKWTWCTDWQYASQIRRAPTPPQQIEVVMHVKRFADAKPYEAPNHYDMRSLRLQGFEPGGPAHSWVGLSYFLPGGGAGPDSSTLEKVYVVLTGTLTVRASGREVTLGPLDSCCIPGGETREVKNLGNEIVTMIVVMPYPDAPK